MEEKQPFVRAPQPDKIAGKAPRACTGAGPFLCIMFSWCLLTFLIPLAILLPIYLSLNVSYSAVLIVLCILSGIGLLLCCFSLRAVLLGACCPPPIPPEHTPFEKEAQIRPVKSLVLIVNPFGGGGKGLVTLEKVIMPIWRDEYKLQVRVLKTEFAGHTVELARDADLTGVDGLCILGGDGSMHELVNGFLQRDPVPDVVLGLLPGGSGNSVMKDLGTWDVAEACRRVARGASFAMDANRVRLSDNCIHSINEISWGLVGDVGVVSEGWRWIGPVRYDLCAMWSLAKAQRRMCDLKIDDQEQITADFTTLFVNQTQYFGKGLRACPAAMLDDGLFDMVYLLDATRGQKLLVFLQLPVGRHGNNSALTFKQARRVKFTPHAGEGVLNIDGENYPFAGSIEIELVPAAFRIFAAAPTTAAASPV